MIRHWLANGLYRLSDWLWDASQWCLDAATWLHHRDTWADLRSRRLPAPAAPLRRDDLTELPF